jgi:hypothetical protein
MIRSLEREGTQRPHTTHGLQKSPQFGLKLIPIVGGDETDHFRFVKKDKIFGFE